MANKSGRKSSWLELELTVATIKLVTVRSNLNYYISGHGFGWHCAGQNPAPRGANSFNITFWPQLLANMKCYSLQKVFPVKFAIYYFISGVRAKSK